MLKPLKIDLKINNFSCFATFKGNETKVKEAMEMIEDKTCVRFVPHSNQPDFVVFNYTQSSCASEVGKQGGLQEVPANKYEIFLV